MEDVTLHFYRYPCAERVLKCGLPEWSEHQAIGHDPKVVHYAYSKNAEIPVPSLDDREEHWNSDPCSKRKAQAVSVEFQQRFASANNSWFFQD